MFCLCLYHNGPVSRNSEPTNNSNQMQYSAQSRVPSYTAQNDGFQTQNPDFDQPNMFTPPGPPPMPPPQDASWQS